jgi:hypothetical protein
MSGKINEQQKHGVSAPLDVTGKKKECVAHICENGQSMREV